MVSGKDGAIGGLSVLAFDFTLNVNSRLFGIGKLGGGERNVGLFTGEARALGGAAGTNGGEFVVLWGEGRRTGRATMLEGLKPGG